jgi:hypothetical protein
MNVLAAAVHCLMQMKSSKVAQAGHPLQNPLKIKRFPITKIEVLDINELKFAVIPAMRT